MKPLFLFALICGTIACHAQDKLLGRNQREVTEAVMAQANVKLVNSGPTDKYEQYFFTYDFNGSFQLTFYFSKQDVCVGFKEMVSKDLVFT